MDQLERKLFNMLIDKVDKVERDSMSAIEKLQAGFEEIERQKQQKEKELFQKYSDKPVEDLTPLEKGAIREKAVESKEEQERQRLAEAMEQLKERKQRQRNWLNSDTSTADLQADKYTSGAKGWGNQ